MSTKQNMLQSSFPRYEETGVHSTSNNERLRNAYPNSPIYSGKGKHIDDFSDAGIKTWYEDEVLNGSFPPDSEFNESNYDYSLSPSIPNTEPPEGEAKPGEPGSTVVASGKGPNVATMNLDDLASVAMVDPTSPSTPPGSGAGSDVSPNDAASSIGNQGVSVPGDPGASGF